MKIKHVVTSVALSLALGFGAVAGLMANKEAKAVKADELQSYSGSIAIELQYINGDGLHYWDEGGAKLGFRIYNETEPGHMGSDWSELVSSNESHKYVINYTTTGWFDPLAGSETKIDLYRFSSDSTSCSEGTRWNKAEGLSFGNVIYVYGWDNAASSVKYTVHAKSDSYSDSRYFTFRNAKLNNDNFELYSDFNLSDEDEFKVTDGQDHYYAAFSTHASLSSIITGDQYNNISCSEAGTYSMFHKLSNHETYVTTPALAAADKFAQSFLGKTAGYCTGSISSEVQLELKGEYEDLSDIEGAQAAFYNAGVIRGKDVVDYGTYSCEALSRYVNMQEQKGYGDFLGLGTINNPALPSSAYNSLFADSTNNTMIIVISIVATSALAFTTLLVFKKKKQK